MIRQANIIYSVITLITMTEFTTAVAATILTPESTLERPVQDPWIPPATRAKAAIASAPVATRGDALNAQVEAKLKADFDRADTAKTGTLTRTQASTAGLGFIVNHFDDIDRYKTGFVRFDDLKQFLLMRDLTFNSPAATSLYH